MSKRGKSRFTPMTAEELEQVVIPGKTTELIRGKLIVREPPGTYHGMIAANLAYFVTDFVRRNNLGDVFSQDTGFQIESSPDTVRAPDFAFVARGRLEIIPWRGFAPVAPDLIIEVISPDDRMKQVLAKVKAWLQAGVRLAWVIDSKREVAHVYRHDGSLTLVPIDGVLDGEDVLPGFTCPLAEALR